MFACNIQLLYFKLTSGVSFIRIEVDFRRIFLSPIQLINILVLNVHGTCVCVCVCKNNVISKIIRA